MYHEYKALRNALLGSLAALSMYACGGGGGSDVSPGNGGGNNNQGNSSNNPPTISQFAAAPVYDKNSNPIYKYYTEESIAFTIKGSDADGDSLTCKIDFDGDGTDDMTINNCENTQTISISFSQSGIENPGIKVTDGVDTNVYTYSQLNGRQTIGVYNPPQIDCYWNPNPIVEGSQSTLYVNVINPGVTDDNGGGCVQKIDSASDGYYETTYNM